jgi:hypothetical protein
VKVAARVWRDRGRGEHIFAGRAFAAGEERDLGDIQVKPSGE